MSDQPPEGEKVGDVYLSDLVAAVAVHPGEAPGVVRLGFADGCKTRLAAPPLVTLASLIEAAIEHEQKHPSSARAAAKPPADTSWIHMERGGGQ